MSINKLANITLISIVFIIGIGFYLNLPIKTFQRDIRITSLQISVGNYLTWSGHICRYTNRPIEAIRLLTNIDTGLIYTLPDIGTKSTVPLGKCIDVSSKTVIPQYVQPGNYKATFELYTYVNFLYIQKDVVTPNQIINIK